VKVGIDTGKRTIAGKKKDAGRSGISIGITGIAHSSFIVGRRKSNSLLSEIDLSAMVMTGMTGLIGAIVIMIDNLMGRLEEEHPFMIGWGGRLSVHDRLGDRVEYFPRSQEELEEMANARVPDEFIFCRDANTYRVESKENRRSAVRQQQLPPWCGEGLTRTQKRRLQRERQEELSKGENSGQSGDQQQPDPKGKGPSADVNMFFMLPMEFLAPSSDDELEFSDQIAQLALDPMMAIFEKPADDERQHLKALFVKGRVDGQPMTKILIDDGAAINIMPYTVYRKLGKGDQDLTKNDMMLKDFEGNVSPVKGAICVELTIGCKTLPTTFFVISGKGAYNLLLGRDWIHANCCIPSTMHQCLVQWVGDKIEIVPGDSSYVIASAEADTYERTRCISGEAWEKDFLKVADYEIPPIQAVDSEDGF